MESLSCERKCVPEGIFLVPAWMSRGAKRDVVRLRRCLRIISQLLVLAVFALITSSVQALEEAVVRVVYFTSSGCPHCKVVLDEVLMPLREEYGDDVQIKVVDILDSEESSGINADNYEMLVYAEEMLHVPPEERALPMIVVGGEVLIGEESIRERLPCLIDGCIEAGGTSWPDLPGLAEVSVELGEGGFGFNLLGEEVQPCELEEAACEAPAPVWVAYFYEVGCQECSRALYDIRYAESKYPQLIVEEHNAQADAALAEWLGGRLDVPEGQRLAAPAIFVGEDYLLGTDITTRAVMALAEKYATVGAKRLWADFDPAQAEQSIISRFRSFGVLSVAFAGLVDGLNPCAFATVAFFVSYLALSGRHGREILAVGVAFSLGVFLAYLALGLGFYKVLDLLGDLLTTLGRWVYGLTGLLCAVLAVFSFLDLLKARRGEIGDMTLNLPHALRKRINAVIRRGRGARAFVVGSFATGVVVSFLELACTGQVYLPTIVFVASHPEMRVHAVGFLLVYNLLFVLPLLVVFVLAYYGTSSQQLIRFLQRRAATIKVGMTLLFTVLAAWLLSSVALA